MRKFKLIKGIFIALIFLFFWHAGQAQVVEEWDNRVGDLAYDEDYAKDIAVDEDGNIYVVGQIDTQPGTYDYYDILTEKISPDGETLWLNIFGTPGNSTDWPRAVAVDSLGNVFVGAQVYSSDTGLDYATIKYDTNGQELWVVYYNGAAGYNTDCLTDLCLDSQGNIYVTGYVDTDSTQEDYVTIKYNTDGEELWNAQYNYPSEWSRDYAQLITVDGDGFVYVSGYSDTDDEDYLTIKYNPDGELLWTATLDGPSSSDDKPADLAVDACGNVYITGYWRSSTYTDYATVKYDVDGNQCWVASYNGAAGGYDYARAVAVDFRGNVYVTGYSDFGGGHLDDYVTIKYDSTGQTQWTKGYDSPSHYHDRASGIALDSEGYVYVTGRSTLVSTDFCTIKYHPETGDERWLVRYNHMGTSYDEAVDLVLDGESNVIVIGQSSGTYSHYDITTVKYRQLDYSVALEPSGGGIPQIPMNGGVLNFNIEVINNSSSSSIFDVWSEILMPDSSVMGPLIGPVTITLPPDFNADRNRIQVVAAASPVGIYTYNAYTGVYPDSIVGQDYFQFVKLPLVDGQDYYGWSNTGDSFDEWILTSDDVQPAVSFDYGLAQNYPNPFNPLTTISFTLPQDGHVTLQIFDVNGRAHGQPLMDGWRNAGRHEVTWDASELASGVYIYKLQTETFSSARKMVLVK